MSAFDDFPAAHSMDTTWFAVDRDGHLAYFECGEEAAVPALIDDQCQGGDILEELMLSHSGELLTHWRGRHAVEPGAVEWDFLTPGPEGGSFRSGLIMLLRDSEALTLLKDPYVQLGSPTRLDGKLLTPVVSFFIRNDEYRLLHEAGLCEACAGDFHFGNLYRNTLGRLGIFVYTNLEEYGNPPYPRVARPDHPLKLNVLSRDLQERAAQVRFGDVSFDTTQHLQPIEHVPCRTWPDTTTYLPSNSMTERPLPERPNE